MSGAQGPAPSRASGAKCFSDKTTLSVATSQIRDGLGEANLFIVHRKPVGLVAGRRLVDEHVALAFEILYTSDVQSSSRSVRMMRMETYLTWQAKVGSPPHTSPTVTYVKFLVCFDTGFCFLTVLAHHCHFCAPVPKRYRTF